MASVDSFASMPSAGEDETPPLPAPFRWEGPHVTTDLGRARVVFSTRRGGTSKPPWDSLNLGSQVGDDSTAVHANRQLLASHAAMTWREVRHGRQVHGAVVQQHGEIPGEPRDADGQLVAGTGSAALVLVADCLPVVVASDVAVVALHAGWRGLVAGILDEGVSAVRAVSADKPLRAALGPCARGCCYEVGEEVHEHFEGYGARRGIRNLDLAHVARRQLERHGIEENADCGLCTMCHPALFFSHRRDEGRTGRQGALAWLA